MKLAAFFISALACILSVLIGGSRAAGASRNISIQDCGFKESPKLQTLNPETIEYKLEMLQLLANFTNNSTLNNFFSLNNNSLNLNFKNFTSETKSVKAVEDGKTHYCDFVVKYNLYRQFLAVLYEYIFYVKTYGIQDVINIV